MKEKGGGKEKESNSRKCRSSVLWKYLVEFHLCPFDSSEELKKERGKERKKERKGPILEFERGPFAYRES